jgi:hypothetical protein
MGGFLAPELGGRLHRYLPVLSVVGWEGLVVACCMPELQLFSIILFANIISLLVPGAMRVEEVFAPQYFMVAALSSECKEVYAVTHRWV